MQTIDPKILDASAEAAYTAARAVSLASSPPWAELDDEDRAAVLARTEAVLRDQAAEEDPLFAAAAMRAAEGRGFRREDRHLDPGPDFVPVIPGEGAQ